MQGIRMETKLSQNIFVILFHCGIKTCWYKCSSMQDFFSFLLLDLIMFKQEALVCLLGVVKP